MKPETRRISAWIAFAVALIASFSLATFVFLPLWKPLFLAAVLATVTYGPYARLTERLRGHRNLAAGLMTVAVIFLLLIPIAVIATVVIREAIDAYEFVSSAMREGGVDALLTRLPDRIEGPLRRLLAAMPVRPEELSRQATGGGLTVARIIGDVVAGVSHVVFSLAMMLIAYFALLTDGKRLLAWIEDVSPLRGRQTIELLCEFRTVSRSVLRSTVLTAMAQATVATIGYAIVGIPNAVFFGFLTFFAAFIPSVGTAIIAVPLAILLLVLGETWQGIFLAIWAVGVVGLVDNLLKPILIRGGMQLHGVVIFFALLGGILVFGAIGLLVGPLAVTFFLTMIRFGYRDFSTRLPPSHGEDVPAPAKPTDVAR